LTVTNKLVQHTHNTNPKAEIRKKHQLLRIENACKDIYLRKSISVTTQSNRSHINKLVCILDKSKYGFTFTQLTTYLGVVSFKSRKRRLSSILTEFCNTHDELDELNLSKKAEIITNKNWDNKIIVSRYLYGESDIIGYPGEQPVFWQINNLNIAKDIYFLRISIANLFNPGFFYYQMR